uniref:Alpha-mannosidase n=1 Tax=Biomphalaria glabrata TaxID=6526 RepID=A0A2C9K725_BIOGL
MAVNILPRSCTHQKSLKWIFIVGVIYLVLIWFGYKSLEKNISQMHRSGHSFHPRLKKDGSIQFYAKECESVHMSRSSLAITSSFNPLFLYLNSSQCQVHPPRKRSNIQMEYEWSSISVGYPQYVYTVSGWIQVINVENYDSKPLQIFIIPHSHQDPGWRETFEGYFNSYTRNTLDYVIKHLNENPDLKFIWSEVSYLERWSSLPESKTDQLKRLIDNGQLEIVTGGWVMTDEAVAHYTSMLDQLMEGHLWLHKHGISTNTSWSVDPFGHSPTMTYLLKRAEINHMVIQRIHFAIKRHFANQKNLEFYWRQAWDSDDNTGVFCHMMPFLLYSIHYSCGPDPHVCCQFDFHTDKCFRGKETIPKITVDDTNIRKLAWALWEQFQKKASLYRSNILLVPHGDDFRYSSQSEWTEQFGNLGKLMDYMNKNKDMNIQIQYGTLSDYFQAVEIESQKNRISFPSLAGDFFPYNDRDDQYWTGYYSSRPLFKHMTYVLQAKLRITEILFSLLCAQLSEFSKSFCSTKEPVIVDARRSLGLFQHHDAITGTSKKRVMEDYSNKLHNTVNQVEDLLALLMLNSLLPKLDKVSIPTANTLLSVENWQSPTSVPVLRISEFKGKWFVLVVNPLTIQWVSPITIRTSTPCIVKTKQGTLIPSQINPVFSLELQPVAKLFDIVFIANITALSLQMYELHEETEEAEYATITVYGDVLHIESFLSVYNAVHSGKELIHIESTLLKATFSACSGTLQYILRKTDETWHKTSVQMMTYGTGSWINPFKDKSGAYIFMPDGYAQELEIYYPTIVVVKGPVLSRVLTKLPGVRHSASLYNVSGPVGAGVHLDNLVDISTQEFENKELMMRITTDISNLDSTICVDLNGYQMHRKQFRAKFLIQGNFHPMTSMAYIEDRKQERVTLITSEPHGVASLTSDSLEVILDRRLMQDDWRGLNEGPNDNRENPSKFILLVEKRDFVVPSKGPMKASPCYPSLLAHLLATHLHNPPHAVMMPTSPVKSSVRLISQPWPCHYDLVKLRFLELSKTSVKSYLVLHNTGIDCSFTQIFMDCSMQQPVYLNMFSEVKVSTAVETSLTGVKELSHVTEMKVKLSEMEIKTIKLTFR